MQEKIIIPFLTQNKHKFLEAKEALSAFNNVVLEQLNEPKYENKDDSVDDPLKNIAISAAVKASKEHNTIVAAEDAGIFFEEYPNFPGMNTKWLIKSIGFDGILRLLEGKNRAAYFRAVVAVSNPKGAVKVFEGIVKGRIAEQVCESDVDCMDYDRIFIPTGSDVPFALMMDDKRTMSHRYLAFKNLGEFFSKGGCKELL